MKRHVDTKQVKYFALNLETDKVKIAMQNQNVTANAIGPDMFIRYVRGMPGMSNCSFNRYHL